MFMDPENAVEKLINDLILYFFSEKLQRRIILVQNTKEIYVHNATKMFLFD